MKDYVAGPPIGWRYWKHYPPPRGKKIQMLTEERLCVLGYWQVGMRAWAPLLEIDDELEKLLDAEDEEIRSQRPKQPEVTVSEGGTQQKPKPESPSPCYCLWAWGSDNQEVDNCGMDQFENRNG